LEKEGESEDATKVQSRGKWGKISQSASIQSGWDRGEEKESFGKGKGARGHTSVPVVPLQQGFWGEKHLTGGPYHVGKEKGNGTGKGMWGMAYGANRTYRKNKSQGDGKVVSSLVLKSA